MKAAILLLTCPILSGRSNRFSVNNETAWFWPKENNGNVHLSRTAERQSSRNAGNMGPYRR